ncbi:LysR family transcriptional regulator [Stutzerimonas stutzeri]
MSEPSLDQLRVLAEVVDCGSFSAAARRLGRSQPVISYSIANLEALLSLTLFERGKRRPTLTESGAAVLAYARRMCLLSDELQAGVENLGKGLEGEISLAVDVLYPNARLAELLGQFAAAFPGLALRIESVPLGKVLQLVEARMCVLGISGLFHDWPDYIEPRDFGHLQMVPVAAPDHPLAAYAKAPPMAVLREHLQLILDDASGLTHGRPLAISGVRTWKVTDFDIKLELLRAGVGWGHMPMHRVEDDLRLGRLVRLAVPIRQHGVQSFTLIHRVDTPPGRAGSWLAQLLIEYG